MRRFIAILILFGVGSFFWLTRPEAHTPLGVGEGDAKNGALLATAGACASCHGADFAGGEALYSPFGTFYAPNITGLEDWSLKEFALALREGVKDGEHLYPAFPYLAYSGLLDQEVADLWAYIQSVPKVEKPSLPHEIAWYARWRRPLGLWKKLAQKSPQFEEKGAHLAENLAHCQECHSPRNFIGILDENRAYQGGVIYGENGTVKSKVPSLLDGDSALWSKSELVEYFTTGFTPDYDSAGGKMVGVVENLAKLPIEEREALADYILSLHPGENSE